VLKPCKSHVEISNEMLPKFRAILLLNNICSLIVDNGSCCNCCSTMLVEKLALTILPHPKAYKLQWLNEGGDLNVNQQVKVNFSIRNYEDKVLYDIVRIEACHIFW